VGIHRRRSGSAGHNTRAIVLGGVFFRSRQFRHRWRLRDRWHRPIQAFGVLAFLDYVLSLYLFIGTLISVWCFFAAAMSGVLYFHFSKLRTA